MQCTSWFTLVFPVPLGPITLRKNKLSTAYENRCHSSRYQNFFAPCGMWMESWLLSIHHRLNDGLENEISLPQYEEHDCHSRGVIGSAFRPTSTIQVSPSVIALDIRIEFIK